MDDRPKDDAELQELLKKFNNEANKTVQLIEALKERAVKITQKCKHIRIPEIKQNVIEKASAELEDLTEKLVTINIDLELDYVDSPNHVVKYFVPGENTIHKLKFLSGDNPWNFWLVDSNVDTKGILKNLFLKFQNNLLEPVKQPKAAQSVCFIDKNKVIRGIVIQIKDENRIKLVDCDSNATKVVTIDKLYKIDEEACHTHAAALRCTITEEPDSIELWKNCELRDIFCNALREATLGVKIIKRITGSFPMFVVDVELRNDEEESTASLREWILDRLLPELKKLGSSDNELTDYLSEESLSPYYKGVNYKDMIKDVPRPSEIKENISTNQSEVQNQEMNNLDYPTDKLSVKVTNLVSPEENNSGQDVTNDLDQNCSENSSSLGYDSHRSNSKESLVSGSSDKTDVLESKLNCHSKEFRPRTKKPDIPRLNRKYQNRTPEYIQPYPNFGQPAAIGFVPPLPSWPYVGQPLLQGPPAEWAPSPNSALGHVNPELVPNFNRTSNVNAMASEFVPRNSSNHHSTSPNKVELPKEQIRLRKPVSLINENENLLGMISHVESPSEFYVNLVTKNNRFLDKRLRNDMFTYYSTREKLEFQSWREACEKLGKFCACKWPEDNQWYRAEVLDWQVGGGQVKVQFVDHGNTEVVTLSHIQPLAKCFEIMTIASQACHLAKVHPLVKGQPWSPEAIGFFKSKVKADNNKVYSIKLVRSNAMAVKDDSFSVMLYEKLTTDSSKSINEMMVEEGLAWCRNFQGGSTPSVCSETYHSMDSLSDTLPTALAGDLTLPTLDETNSLRSSECNLPSVDTGLGLLSPESTLPSLDTTSIFSPESNLSSQSSFAKKDAELTFDFEHWDPLREDYESVRNNPALDTDDACVAVSGYSAQDEARICKHYARRGFCYKDVCFKEHSMPREDGTTTDKFEEYQVPFSELELPSNGEVVRLKITHVASVMLFYAQIEEKKAVAVDEECQEDAETLTSLEKYMNQPENVLQMRGLRVDPGIGDLVLARWVDKESGSEWWYRARVISLGDDNLDDDTTEIMYVDYGTTCKVSIRDLRKMEDRYLHLPFQAIECSLANIIPVNKGDCFKRATELLDELLTGEILTATIYDSEEARERGAPLQVFLQLVSGIDVGDFLVENNLCQPRPFQTGSLQYL